MSEALIKQGFKQIFVKDVEFFYKELGAEAAFDLAYTILQKAAIVIPKIPQDQEMNMEQLGDLLLTITQQLPKEELKALMKQVWSSSSLLKDKQVMSFERLKASELVLAILVTIEICKEELAPFFHEAMQLAGIQKL